MFQHLRLVDLVGFVQFLNLQPFILNWIARQRWCDCCFAVLVLLSITGIIVTLIVEPILLALFVDFQYFIRIGILILVVLIDFDRLGFAAALIKAIH